MARKNKRRRSPLIRLLRTLIWLFRNVMFAGGLWILYSRLFINHRLALGPAVNGNRKDMDSQAAGRLSYYSEEGKGRPLVLLHSVNAAASAYEMKPLFEHYQGQRPVYALDLPGYGFSERSPRTYTPGLFSAAIVEFLETQVGKAADVVALSLGAEFAARVVLEKPTLVHSLALISPAGMTARGSASQRLGRSVSSERLHEIFAAPLWGQPLYDLIVTRTSIRYFLKRSFVGAVPEDLVDYDYATSHQPGAEIVPLYFISGALFTPDALETLYKKVTIPGLVIYDQDAYTGFDGLPELLDACSNWQAQRITPSKGLPHFENLEQTVKVLEDFWASIA
jgi:pimeloyl-ACP methyl ester carboxylesterase